MTETFVYILSAICVFLLGRLMWREWEFRSGKRSNKIEKLERLYTEFLKKFDSVNLRLGFDSETASMIVNSEKFDAKMDDIDCTVVMSLGAYLRFINLINFSEEPINSIRAEVLGKVKGGFPENLANELKGNGEIKETIEELLRKIEEQSKRGE